MRRKLLRFLTIAVMVVLLNCYTSEVNAEEKLYYIYSDHLGSTTLVTDEGGNVVSQQSYYPYGEIRALSSNIPTERQYTGQVSDTDQTGLYYYNARYYNPQIALFTQADTVNNDGLNRYFYVGGNPITYNDPTGHCRGVGCWLENAWNSFTSSFAQGYQNYVGSELYFMGQSSETHGTPSVNYAFTQGTFVAGVLAAGVGGWVDSMYEMADAGVCMASTGGDPMCAAGLAPGISGNNVVNSGKLGDVVDAGENVVKQSDELAEAASLSLDGGLPHLDIGGGTKEGYFAFGGGGDITVNINPSTKPHVQADARALPFADNSFAAAKGSNLEIDELANPAVWSEAARVTQPGGTVYYRGLVVQGDGKVWVSNRQVRNVFESVGLGNVAGRGYGIIYETLEGGVPIRRAFIQGTVPY